MQVTAVLNPDSDGGFTPLNAETGCMSEGDTIEDAIGNLREAVELYLGEFPLRITGAPLVTTFTLERQA